MTVGFVPEQVTGWPPTVNVMASPFMRLPPTTLVNVAVNVTCAPVFEVPMAAGATAKFRLVKASQPTFTEGLKVPGVSR